jgi:hypothetical protein
METKARQQSGGPTPDSLFKSEQHFFDPLHNAYFAGANELERVVGATAETLMKKATTGFVGGYEEGRHHMGQEPVEAGPTMGTMDELPSARAGFSLRIKPDRRRLVIPVDPAIDRRRSRHNGGT